MSRTDSNTKDTDIIEFFESQLAKRKNLPNRELWLADLKDIYEALMPYLPISDSAKIYIKKIIAEANRA